MPFTVAHPAAVLPLRRAGLPVAALVIGAMVPDVPLFVPVGPRYPVTHSWAGVVTLDVGIGLLVLALWSFVLRDAAVDLAPDVVRRRVAARHRPGIRSWALALPALAVGAATHVVWDAFTHPGRWGADLVPWLAERHGAQLGSQWAQWASGLLGLVVVGWWVWRELRALPWRTDVSPRRFPRWLVLIPLLVAALVGAVAAARHEAGGVEVMAYQGVVIAMGAGVLAVLGVAGGWHLADRASQERKT